MLNMQPKSSAAWCHRQSRSSLQGWALISTATPYLAKARSTFSISISYPGRLASGHMAQDRGARVGDRAELTGGLLFLIQLEATMDTYDEVEPTKNFIG